MQAVRTEGRELFKLLKRSLYILFSTNFCHITIYAEDKKFDRLFEALRLRMDICVHVDQ